MAKNQVLTFNNPPEFYRAYVANWCKDAEKSGKPKAVREIIYDIRTLVEVACSVLAPVGEDEKKSEKKS